MVEPPQEVLLASAAAPYLASHQFASADAAYLWTQLQSVQRLM